MTENSVDNQISLSSFVLRISGLKATRLLLSVSIFSHSLSARNSMSLRYIEHFQKKYVEVIFDGI